MFIMRHLNEDDSDATGENITAYSSEDIGILKDCVVIFG